MKKNLFQVWNASMKYQRRNQLLCSCLDYSNQLSICEKRWQQHLRIELTEILVKYSFCDPGVKSLSTEISKEQYT